MAETRKGLNCTLTYPHIDAKGKTQNRSFKVRVDTVGYGVKMVAAESSGRNRRAYYPHRVAPSQFYIRPILVGFGERKTFADWMQSYADYVMDPGLPSGKGFPDMHVLVPARKFDRWGVPLSGFERGDTIGGMVWTPTVMFETTQEPQDTEKWSTSKFVAATDPDLKYFWPSGTQLGGDTVPSGNYNTIVGNGNGSDPGQTPEPPPHSSGDPSTGGVPRSAYGQ